MDDLCAELELGVERFERNAERTIRDAGHGQTVGGLAIAERWLSRLVAQLKLSLANTHPLANTYPVTLLLKDLEIESLGLCLLDGCLHCIGSKWLMLETIEYLGRQIKAECWAAGLLRQDKALAKRIKFAAQRANGAVQYRRQAAASLAKRGGYKAKRWGREQVIRAGEWGLQQVQQALPDVVLHIPAPVMDEARIILSDEAEAVADEAVANAVMRHPVWLPLLQPPEPWIAANRNEHGLRADLVRTYDKVRAKAVAHAVKTGQMQPAIDAVNALQSVAWAINEPVLRFQQWVWSQGIRLGLPPKHALPKPEHGPWGEMTEEERKVWRVRASAVAKDNRTYIADRISVREDLATAIELKCAGRFWTAMNMDWRGRVYPLSRFNYQREDRVRGLFLFADGEPVGECGLYWLKVHLANLSDGLGWHGVNKPSKLSFEERAAWTEKSLATIKWIAMVAVRMDQPHLLIKYLMSLDEPYLWLAAAIELSEAMRYGSNFTTRLPVAFDGSCSGLQHLCAMTRAPEGCLVNLTPMERPQDVYQTVANRVTARVTLDAASTDASIAVLAKASLAYGITRSLVKRNVMTYSYSSKQYGMASQHQEDLMEPLRRKVTLGELAEHPFGKASFGPRGQPSPAARYLAGVTYRAIEEVVDLPAQAMAFLQKLARALAHEGKALRWTTPVGLPWINRYTEAETKAIYLWLYDRGVRVRYDVKLATGEEKRGIDKESAANGVAPNFVHALDAAHLLRTALAARELNITALATVHDSFGCLASRGDVFRDVIRREFVRLYTEHDLLREVLAQARADLSEANHDKLPELPTYGLLDLNEVMNADYCFA